jgi:hypothetical protein
MKVEVVAVRKDLEKFQALYHQNMTSIKALERISHHSESAKESKVENWFGL